MVGERRTLPRPNTAGFEGAKQHAVRVDHYHQHRTQMKATTNTYDAEVRRLRGHFQNCDGYEKVGITNSGLVRLQFTYLRAMQRTMTVRMDVSMDQIEEAENNTERK